MSGPRLINGRRMLLSALIGAAAAYAAFVLFLQTALVSPARLVMALGVFAAVAGMHYWFVAKWLEPRLQEAGAMGAAAIGVLLVAVFLPQLYRAPAYPLSPLLSPWAELAVQFEVPAGTQPLVLQADSVRLIAGKEALNTSAFQLVGPWKQGAGSLALEPGSTGSLQWTGTVPETITLSIQPPAVDSELIVYWNGTRTSSHLPGGQQGKVLIVEKANVPWGFNLLFFLSCFVLLAWLLGLAAVLLAERLSSLRHLAWGRAFAWAAVVLCVLLAALTVKMQVDSLSGGTQFITRTQMTRHAAVLQGRSLDPWQYRVLAEYVAEGTLRLAQILGITNPAVAAFIALRVLQNIAIFLVAFALYRRAAGSNLLGVLGILMLAGSMLNAYFDNDVAFNTYFDLLFYLLCALLLLARRYWAVVILTVFAALNRETSALIPFVMAGAISTDEDRPGLRKYVPALLSLLIFVGIFSGLRMLFPSRPLYISYKHAPGAALLLYNVTRSLTWQQLFSMLGLAPLIGLLFYSTWPPTWQRWFLIVCPAWFLIHSFASVMAETRLFLVPQALVFIPGVLFAVRALSTANDTSISQPYPVPGAL